MVHMTHRIETNELGGNRSTRRKPTTSGGSRTHAHVKHSGAQSAALTTWLPYDPLHVDGLDVLPDMPLQTS